MFIYTEWFQMHHLLTCKREESLISCQLFVPVVNRRDSSKDLMLYSSLAVPGYKDVVYQNVLYQKKKKEEKKR